MSDGMLVPFEQRAIGFGGKFTYDHTWATASGTVMDGVIYQSWLHLRVEDDATHPVTIYWGNGLVAPSAINVIRGTSVVPVVHDGMVSVVSEDNVPVKVYYQERRGIAPGN